MVRLGGSFRRDTPRPARSKPLEKSEQEKRWLSKTPEHSGTRLERRNFKAAPRQKELPPGYIYAKAAAAGDMIMAAVDYGDVIGKVLAHRQSDRVVVCLNVATGELFGMAPDTIVELGS